MKYNPVVGFAKLSELDVQKASETLSYSIGIIKKLLPDIQIEKVLVAGCGDGTEAILLQRLLGKYVYGVDISLEKELHTPGIITLKNGDLMNLNLPPQSFDFIYSYHVLEHVPDPIIVLKGLKEILSDKGVMFVGFPNKKRLIGYIGTHNNVSLLSKIKWNLKDYKDKILGRFENHLGAHAGFSDKEFSNLTFGVFNSVIPVRNQYMLYKYSKYRLLIDFFIKTGLSEYLFPSNYYLIKNY
jgi:SAM-dependent methyltransferase